MSDKARIDATSDWSCPEGFEEALRQLYERSFEECDLPPEFQKEISEEFQASGADSATRG